MIIMNMSVEDSCTASMKTKTKYIGLPENLIAQLEQVGELIAHFNEDIRAGRCTDIIRIRSINVWIRKINTLLDDNYTE